MRVTGPFTVEAVPAPTVKSRGRTAPAKPSERSPAADDSVARSGETLRQAEWRDELLRTGIRGKGGQMIRFSRVEPLPGTPLAARRRRDQAQRRRRDPVSEERSGVSPQRVVDLLRPGARAAGAAAGRDGLEEAQNAGAAAPSCIVFAAFQFDPEAAKDIDETQMAGRDAAQGADERRPADRRPEEEARQQRELLADRPAGRELRRNSSARRANKGKLWQVEVHGFDYYNTKTGKIESGGARQDRRVDARHRLRRPQPLSAPGLLPDGRREGWLGRLARNLKAEIDEDLIEPIAARSRCRSLPASIAASPSKSWTTGASRA